MKKLILIFILFSSVLNAQIIDDGIMPYTGTIHHNVGDVIYVQYLVTNVAMDFEGAAIFDNPVAFSVNFECINSH